MTAAGLALLSPPKAQAGPAAARLVIDRDFPDPSIVEFNGGYYAHATNSGGRNVQVARADELRGPWQPPAEALPAAELPKWVGPDSRGRLNIWAPHVSRRTDGAFLLYYTAFHPGAGHQCLGAAVADTPAGPFTPTGPQPLVCGSGRGDVIDPAAFVDSDGLRYLLYKDSRGGSSTIRSLPVDRDGVTPRGGETVLLRATRPEEAGVVEAPTLVRRPEGYVLFYSANTFASGDYFTNYATASTLTGPYTKAPGALLSRRTLGGGITDPGGQDVSESGSHIVFHGDLVKPGGPRGAYLAELGWDGSRPRLLG